MSSRITDPSTYYPADDDAYSSPGHRGVTFKDILFNLIFSNGLSDSIPLSSPANPYHRSSPSSALNEAINPSSRPESYDELPLPDPLTDLLSTKLPESVPLIGGSLLGDFIPIIQEIPSGQDRLSNLTRPRESVADFFSLPADVAGLFAPISPKSSSPTRNDAVQGIKRHKRYYHGIKDNKPQFDRDGPNPYEKVRPRDSILEKGFTQGQSSELELPGTSLSEDPFISYNLFTDPIDHSTTRLDNVLAVDVEIPPSEVYNLKPEEYITGQLPDDGRPGTVYRKPNAFYKEAETFGIRGELSIDQQLKYERARNEAINKRNDLRAVLRERNELNPVKQLDELNSQIRYYNDQLASGKLSLDDRTAYILKREHAHNKKFDLESRMKDNPDIDPVAKQLEQIDREIEFYNNALNKSEAPPPFTARELNNDERRQLLKDMDANSRFNKGLHTIENPSSTAPYYISRTARYDTPELGVKEMAGALRDLRGNRGSVLRVIESIPSAEDDYFWDVVSKASSPEKSKRLMDLKAKLDEMMEKSINDSVDRANPVSSEEYRKFMRLKDEFVDEFIQLAPTRALVPKPKLPGSTATPDPLSLPPSKYSLSYF